MIIFEEKFFELSFCEDIAKKVYSQKNNLYQREGISTLGYNMYQSLWEIGVKECFENYCQKIESTNEYMRDIFPSVYEVLLQKMSNLFGIECKYCERLILPGFQIIPSSSPSPRIWHYDDEKTLFNWNMIFPGDKPVEDLLKDSITFTIMIQSPEKSTYDYFPQTYSLYTKNRDQKVCSSHVHLIGDICSNQNCLLKDSYETITYSTGALVLTKNRYLHRVGKSYFSHNSSYRITLQGHGIFFNNTLYLYW